MTKRQGSSAPDPLDCSTPSGDLEPSGNAGAAALVPALTVLYHREPRRIGERVLLPELSREVQVALSRTMPRFSAPDAAPERGEPLGDPRLSRQAVWLAAAPAGGLQLIVEGPQARVRYQGEPVVGQRVISASELGNGGVLELNGAVALVLHLARSSDGVDVAGTGLLGHSHYLHALRANLRRLAALEMPVLIRGESGTGKELAAQALHSLGARAAGPFIAVNLGAIPPSLAAAELFGAERGAFTGAAARQPGYFQQARGGTLFLDELGEAPLEIQALLLRAIETGEVRPLGAGAAQKVNARLVAATDADLAAMIAAKTFRLPLLHRLSTCELHLPALRQRREDIGPLVLHFLRTECAAQGRPYLLDRPGAETGPWLPLRLMATLAASDWPGNVRQLRNVVRQMVAGSERQLSLELPAGVGESLRAVRPEPALPAPAEPPSRRKPAAITEAELVDALQKNRSDLKATAAALGIARPSLYMLLERWPHIRTARNLTIAELIRCHRERGGDVDAMAAQLGVSREALRRRLRELQLR